jgi:hypothetical protein
MIIAQIGCKGQSQKTSKPGYWFLDFPKQIAILIYMSIGYGGGWLIYIILLMIGILSAPIPE